MATVQVIANVSGQALLFTTPKNVKGVLTSINIDNQSGAAHIITFKDVFTPDPSASTPSPTVQQLTRFQTSLISGALLQNTNINRLALEDVEVLGSLYSVADALDNSCVIVVNYHFA